MSDQDRLAEHATNHSSPGPVECLGITFNSDAERRQHFLELLREKLKDPEFRRIEGFPLGDDETILSLSDPPYYTACPNPFVGSFISHVGSKYDGSDDSYLREPFPTDIHEGKNEPIYNVHSYHTKVPHKAIMRFLLHYTNPGDVVLDAFCGTGMTGVACSLCAEHASDRAIAPSPGDVLGRRHAILVDLAPIATFIGHAVLSGFSTDNLVQAANGITERIQANLGHLYETAHTGWKVRDRKTVEHKRYDRGDAQGTIEFVLMSDVVRCPDCSHEFPFYSVAVDEENDKLRKALNCPSCSVSLSAPRLERVVQTTFDNILGSPVEQVKTEVVLINYSVGNTRFEKCPDALDEQHTTEAITLTQEYRLPVVELIEGKETRRNVPIGITHVHHFFAPLERVVVAALLREMRSCPDYRTKTALLFALTAVLPYASRMRRFRADRKGGGPLSGTLYVSSLTTPPNVIKAFLRSVRTMSHSLSPPVDPARGNVVSTQSASDLRFIPDHSIDYIFADPPFGSNFDYSELNFFWEALLGVVTNQNHEAIVSTSQSKSPEDYRYLMTECFRECHRVLKPGRWMTVEFSNTKAAVWNAIQSSLEMSGFVVANVSALDKKQKGFKALTTPTAVKQDLIISAYKPTTMLEQQFTLEMGSAEGAWSFIQSHLEQLPVFVASNGKAQVISERVEHMLFDRMVAFHVQSNVTVPISAGEFYCGLGERFARRDGMYFLTEQVAEYDKRRLKTKELVPLELFVTDEASAIQWIKQQLTVKPQTYQDLNPLFMKELAGAWEAPEKGLELSELLQQKFLCYDGVGDVPSQIHSYLSSSYHDLRKLNKEDPKLITKAKNRWYVPDPRKEADLEKIRQRALMKEFDEYRRSKSKLKVVRTEALRAGFKECWQKNDYQTIVDLAHRVKEDIIQEDPALLMYYDNAQMLLGE